MSRAFIMVFVGAFTEAFTGAFTGATVVTLVALFELLFLTEEVPTTDADVCCFNGLNDDFSGVVGGDGAFEWRGDDEAI